MHTQSLFEFKKKFLHKAIKSYTRYNTNNVRKTIDYRYQTIKDNLNNMKVIYHNKSMKQRLLNHGLISAIPSTQIV